MQMEPRPQTEDLNLVFFVRCCNRQLVEWVFCEEPGVKQFTVRVHMLLWICYEHISSYVSM